MKKSLGLLKLLYSYVNMKKYKYVYTMEVSCGHLFINILFGTGDF